MIGFRRDPAPHGGRPLRRGDNAGAPSRGEVGRAGRHGPEPLLAVQGLDVHYGRAHALQGVSLSLDAGVLGIVGRNGMGKTTLCNAITGLVAGRGSIRLDGREILGLPPHEITRRGIAYVPQGRRVWPSLTVDETLRLVARHRREVERVYALFPRLAERKGNGGSQLSGGEQQMLAIGRALLLEPRLLVMDEPTEGLAPVIVEQVAKALRELASDGAIAVLLIEQNLGVAIDVADRIGVMVNGRILHEMPASQLAADRPLQERLLGVRSATDDEADDAMLQPQASAPQGAAVEVLTVRRAHGGGGTGMDLIAPRAGAGFNRWSASSATLAGAGVPAVAAPAPGDGVMVASSPAATGPTPAVERAPAPVLPRQRASVIELPVAQTTGRAAYVAGTFDTKGRELNHLRLCLEKIGLRVVTVDLSTSGRSSAASVSAREVARHHPGGEAAVFSGDRGSAVAAMTLAFEHYILTRTDLGGLISAGGSGGTTLATAAMRALPVGVPKVMVSTMASGDTRPYVGPSDICMMHAVTDVQGINRISERVLGNAAHALAGMIAHPVTPSAATRPALGLTMFGVTTPCVQQVTKLLGDTYDCLVFHATGVGGQSMEKLADSGLLEGVIDVSTTEIADEVVGGSLSAGSTRLDVFARRTLPWVGSLGALDMVNFGAWDTVPERFKGRRLYRHNPNVTLMRTTADECRAIGEFMVAKLNAMQGPVRLLIPEGGLSAIDRPGQPFHDPQADQVLIDTLVAGLVTGTQRRVLRLPHHINDEAFAQALVDAWGEVHAQPSTARQARRA